MLKFTALALGALTAISIAPSAQAIPIGVNINIGAPVHPVVIRPANRWDNRYQQRRREAYIRRELELERDRDARWESSRYPNDYNRVYINPVVVPTVYTPPVITEYREHNGGYYPHDRR
jgi:hypothetical protein